MNTTPFSEEATRLMMAVEQLSMQDQRRIVRLIRLLARASDELCEQAQDMLRRLIAAAPEIHADCLSDIDEIIERVEQQLEIELHLAAARGRTSRAAQTLL